MMNFIKVYSQVTFDLYFCVPIVPLNEVYNN